MAEAPAKKPSNADTGLVRALGVSHAGAIVVGTIIGSGVFLVPAEMMQAVGSARLVYLAWIVGGVLSFFGALTYAELGAMKPQAGGEYVYVRDAYGPLAGFLYAWAWFLIAKPASIATVTIGLVRILGTFQPLSFLPHTAFAWPIPISYGQLLAIAATLLISALNYIGVRRAGDFQLVFTVLKVAMIMAIVIIGFTYAQGTWSNFATTYAGAKGGLAGFMIALVAALWAYDGWNDLNMVSGEIHEPERSIPTALIAGVFRAALVSAGMALSMLVTLNGTVMSGARIPFAVARDGYFFNALAEVHPRFRTPSMAIIVQAVLSILLLLFAGTFRQLFSLAIFAEWLFYMLAASTVFIFRRREPNATRPYKTWGYPVVPALFIAASAILLYYTFTENLRNSAIGSLVILAGIPVFFWFARQKLKMSGPF